MKKTLLSLIAILAFSQVFSQYYYVPFIKEGKNPRDLNTESESPYPGQPSGWSTLWNGDGSSAVAYTANQTLPFAFKFNGAAVTDYKVSNAGFVTFSTSDMTNVSSFTNETLPSTNIPDKSVCILGLKPQSKVENGSTYKSAILTKTFGTAPNRQFWIQFNFFGEANINTGWSFWSVVLEEGSNLIHIVDMRTLCVNGTALCGNNVKLSAGIQINKTTATSIAGSPNLMAGNITTNIFNVTDNSYYTYRNGVQPAGDLAALKLNVPDYLALTMAPFTINGTFMNQGSAAVSNFDFAYKINNGAPVVAKVTTGIAVNGRMSVDHPTKWTPTEGTYKVSIWPVNVNGVKDGIAGNDTIFKTVIVVPTIAVRKPLHEIFTSSTCGPCAPGNKNTDENIFPNKSGLYTVIKYQQDFPGTGDPYATNESVNRRSSFYAINSIPRMEVDGGWDGNASSYTLSLFDQFAAEPAFLKIDAKHLLHFKTVKVDVKITPLIDFANSNLKMFIAINEKSTNKNIKSNGETEFKHVMKKMLPNENGTVIGNMTKNVDKTMAQLSYSFEGAYRLPNDGQSASRIKLATENSVEEFSDLEVVVFIQDVVTKKVYQSEYSVGTTSGIDNPVGVKESFVIYPNPSNGNTSIRFRLDNSRNLNVSLYNSLGQMVKVIGDKMFDDGLNNLEFSTEGLTKGLYFVKINGENFTTTQNFIVN